MPTRSTLWLQSRVGQGLLSGALCAALAMIFTLSGYAKGVERAVLDAMFYMRGEVPVSKHIVIIKADESTVEAIGAWPFRRDIYANLVERLNKLGAKTIAFDVQFPAKSNIPAADLAFVEACRKAGNVIQTGVFYLPNPSSNVPNPRASPSLNQPVSARFRLQNRVADDRFGLDAGSGSAVMLPLLESAAGLGHVTVFPEWGGALRRIPHAIRYRGNTYPSLALASAAHFMGVKANDIIVSDDNIQIGDRRIPIDSYGEALVNWCVPTDKFSSFTFQQVLAKSGPEALPEDYFKDAVVLVGITHPGAYEHYATSLSPNQPAVELQATALDNILENRPLREAPFSWLAWLMLFTALAAGLLTSQRGARQGAIWMIIMATLLWLGGMIAMKYFLLYIAMGAPLLALFLTCAVTLGYRQIRDSRDLKIADERYALALKGANDGIWDYNLQDKKIYYSTRWQTMLGVEPGVLQSATPNHELDSGVLQAEVARPGVLQSSLDEWTSRIHPDDASKFEIELQRHIVGESPHFEYEHRIRHADGEYRWVLARGLRVVEDGKPTRMAGSLSDISSRKQAEAELRHNAFYDGLTGLPNRALFMDRLGRALARARRHPDYLFAVLFLDLDRFKVINDSLGHGMGDKLLVSVAQRLETCLRPGDTAARLGGDEFTLLLDEIEDIEDATRVTERIQTALREPFDLQGHEVVSTASVGIVVAREKGGAINYEQPEELLRDADTALYRAKALGRARHEIFDEAMHVRAVSLLQLEADLRRAFENEELRAFYQPIVAMENERIVGFEALVRWQHPTRGMVSPGEFIAVAEETGLITTLDKWVLRAACRQTLKWQQQIAALANDELPPLSISVNLSSRHFSNADLPREIKQLLEEENYDPRFLRLEITEGVILENVDSATAMLDELKAVGLTLAIDDFGTGYSSLSYLHRLPLDILKIDRSFITRLGQDGENSGIVEAIISLARNLGMKTTAEGIELPEQLKTLQSLGCHYGQGYLFSRPLDADGARNLLMKDRGISPDAVEEFSTKTVAEIR